jgi:hypothetical protein
MKSTLAAIALTVLLAGSPAFAATSTNDTTGMSQSQDSGTQKQKHKKHHSKKRHSHKKSSDSSNTSGTAQQ